MLVWQKDVTLQFRGLDEANILNFIAFGAMLKQPPPIGGASKSSLGASLVLKLRSKQIFGRFAKVGLSSLPADESAV